MTLSHFLSGTSVAATLITDGVLLFVLVSAFKTFRHRGIAFLIFAYALGLFHTVCDHALNFKKMNPHWLQWYDSLRKMTHIADNILFAIGVVLIVRSLVQYSAAGASGIHRPARH